MANLSQRGVVITGGSAGIDQVDDVAAAALFLASPEASYITGGIMNMNGG